MAKLENDLSKGSVVKQLLMFSIPFIISNLIQTLYNVVDMIIVGRFSGAECMSGVNIGGQITYVITNAVIGLSIGATVLIGQYMGYGARKELKETIGTLFTTLFILAVLFTTVSIWFRAPILKLIQTPQDSFIEAENYLFVTMLGTIFIFGYNALSAVMRGMGDSKSPLYFVAISCVINIVLDLVLVAGLDMRAMGAAIATVLSQGVSMLLCILYLRNKDFAFDFKLESFKIKKERLKMLLKIGIPSSVQNVMTGISFLFLTTLVNTLGVTASAAVGAVGKYNGFAILPAVAMSSSISAMSAQNIGAGEEKRAVKTMYYGMLIAVIMSWSIYLITILFPEQIMRIFTSDTDIIENGIEYIKSFSLDYLAIPIFFSLNGLFIGCGHTNFSLINNILSSLLLRIPVAYIFGIVLDMGLSGIGLAAPIATFVSTIIGCLFYLSGRWKKLTIINNLE